MDIGIGMPNTVRGTTGAQLLEWGRRAEQAGFASLASIGALEYPGYEELTAFAAIGAVTDRIRLFSNVLIAPLRSTAELAKQAATVDQISGGRLTLGLGVGWRQADYQLAGRDHGSRGQAFDQQLADLKRAWAGEPLIEGTRPVSPPPAQGGGVPIMVGGNADAAVRRTVQHGIGWTAGGLPPEAVKDMADKVRAAWSEAGRDGAPRIAALLYFALGDEALAGTQDYIRDYYSPMGEETAEMIAGSIVSSPEALQGVLGAYDDAGVDELYFDPGSSDPEQVDRLADAVLG